MTEYLIKLKLACGAGTEHFDSEKCLREREAFGLLIMGWRSARTIDIYDQSRQGEASFAVLAGYQQDLSQRRYTMGLPIAMNTREQRDTPEISPQPAHLSNQESAIVWMHDPETLDWIKSMERQAGQQS